MAALRCLFIALALAMLIPAHAGAAPSAVVVSTMFTFAPGGDNVMGGAVPGTTGPIVIARGTDVLHVNAETLALDPHSLTSDGCIEGGGDRCWFDSSNPRPQAPGEAAIVKTSHLPAGRYGFFCIAHPVMRGTLVVV